MSRLLRLIAAFGLLCCMATAGAHPSPQSEVLLVGGAAGIRAELVLPLDELMLAFDRPIVAVSGRKPAPVKVLVTDADMAAYLAAHIRPVAPDGRAWVVKVEHLSWMLDRRPADLLATLTLRPPAGAPLDRFTFGDDAIAHQVPSHLTVVALRTSPDATPRLLGTLRFGQRSLEVHGADTRWWSGCLDMFRLGMAHIAEGSDHLLFLLTLLLPAGLLVEDGRWEGYGGARHLALYLAKVVTAFTLGHTLTLMLGAAGALRVPERPVEFAIAFSILVSALHAWRPLFARREGWIAAGFGLVHGLAFAAAIRELQLSGPRLAVGILSFNLGVEAVQILLVAVSAPLLVLLARTQIYRKVRPAATMLAGAVALLWMAQRV
jgi:catechol 2,3-dioxygenase-like lactoylglutathione lyase family enzyme